MCLESCVSKQLVANHVVSAFGWREFGETVAIRPMHVFPVVPLSVGLGAFGPRGGLGRLIKSCALPWLPVHAWGGGRAGWAFRSATDLGVGLGTLTPLMEDVACLPQQTQLIKTFCFVRFTRRRAMLYCFVYNICFMLVFNRYGSTVIWFDAGVLTWYFYFLSRPSVRLLGFPLVFVAPFGVCIACSQISCRLLRQGLSMTLRPHWRAGIPWVITV